MAALCSAAKWPFHLAMRIFAILLLALNASPLAASEGTAVPEPSNLAIFALGVLGVLVGRQAAKRRADDEAE